MTRSRCTVCSRSPDRMNSRIAAYSHINCPHRRRAWSEREFEALPDEDELLFPTPTELEPTLEQQEIDAERRAELRERRRSR